VGKTLISMISWERCERGLSHSKSELWWRVALGNRIRGHAYKQLCVIFRTLVVKAAQMFSLVPSAFAQGLDSDRKHDDEVERCFKKITSSSERCSLKRFHDEHSRTKVFRSRIPLC